MRSNPERLRIAMQHIQRIKAGDYPAIVGRDEQYRIVERPFKDLAEPSKLAILHDAVDWRGVSNRDQAHILLNEIDPGKVTDAQRNRLIDMAAVPGVDEHLDAIKAQSTQAHAPGRGPEIER
jgi:hypothetical protein